MLSYQIAGKIITDNLRVLEDFRFVTVNGKLVVDNSLDYMKLVRLARAYASAVRKWLPVPVSLVSIAILVT